MSEYIKLWLSQQVVELIVGLVTVLITFAFIFIVALYRYYKDKKERKRRGDNG